MKKIISCLCALFLLCGALASCGAKSDTSADTGKKISIVCTIFPEYDWVYQLLDSHRDEAELTLLLDNGVDLHSYQPTADDMIKINECDMFVYAGGESDSWVENVLDSAANKDTVIVNLMDVLADAVKEEEIVDGMEADEHGDEGEEDEPEYDEHVWLSLRNAQTVCKYITDKLCELDAANSADYKKNYKDYNTKLTALDGEYKSAVEVGKNDTLVFADRFPFRYLTDDYGIEYYAAFVGCSAESEASFETVAFLAGKVDELGLGCVVTIEGNDHRIAETVIKNTKDKNQKILSLDSMQGTTSSDIKNGETYLSVMQKNLETLKQALN